MSTAMGGWMQRAGQWMSVLAATAVGLAVGKEMTSYAADRFFRTEIETNDIDARPLRRWGHIPAIENAFGVWMGGSFTSIVLRGLQPNFRSVHMGAALVLFVASYLSTAKVTDRVVLTGPFKTTVYLPMNHFLMQRRDEHYQRVVCEGPAGSLHINISPPE